MDNAKFSTQAQDAKEVAVKLIHELLEKHLIKSRGEGWYAPVRIPNIQDLQWYVGVIMILGSFSTTNPLIPAVIEMKRTNDPSSSMLIRVRSDI